MNKIKILSGALLLLFGANSIRAEVVTTIGTLDEWKAFVTSVNAGDDYSATTVTLTADIVMQTSGFGAQTVGTSANPFKGTFDGQGHKLTYNFSALSKLGYCAPFRFIDGATIKNVIVEGELTVTDNNFLSGLVGYVGGSSTSTISNCMSTLTLTNSAESGDGRIGGLVGYQLGTSTLNISNCMVAGTINARGQGAGIMGYKKGGATLTLTNVLTTCAITGAVDRFVKNESGSAALTNCYYLTSYASDGQGTQATAVELNSGNLAYTLNTDNTETLFWGQGGLNASNAEAYPSLTTDNSKKVLKMTPQSVSTALYVNAGGVLPNAVRYSGLGWRLQGNAASIRMLPTTLTESNVLIRVYNEYLLNVSSAGATTLVLPFDAELPNGVTAYSLAYNGGDAVTATPVDKITANQPVLINAAEGTYTFTVDNESTITYSGATVTNGALTGVYVQAGSSAAYNPIAYVPANSHVLQQGENGLGFYKVDADNTVRITSFRAYLTAETQAPSLSIVFGSETTGINSIDNGQLTMDNSVYDLQGRKISKAEANSSLFPLHSTLKKGLYIVNGRKVVVK